MQEQSTASNVRGPKGNLCSLEQLPREAPQLRVGVTWLHPFFFHLLMRACACASRAGRYLKNKGVGTSQRVHVLACVNTLADPVSLQW